MIEKLDFREFIGDSARETHQLLQTESSPLNMWQCQHLEQKLKVVQQVLETYTGDRSSGPLKELHRYVKEAEDLVRQCCSQPWMRAAISQADNKETFCEVLYDLDWCITLLQDAAASAPQGKRRRRGTRARAQQLANRRRKIKSVNNDAAQKDRDELKVRLEVEIQKPQLSHDDLTLAKYLLARLTDAKASKGVDARRTRGQRIGQGGYGKVYEISWLGEKYAVKVFDSTSETERKSFEREGYSLRSLRHRNVVQLIDHFANDEECSLVMEHMSEGDLYRLIKSISRKPSTESFSSPKSCRPPFSFDVMLDILVQMAKGLQYMHANKTAHRDLKSKNVLVSFVKHSKHLEGEGYVNVKLADFGMAKVKQEISTSFNPTTLNGFVGTSLWKAPELFDDPDPSSVDAFAADVYSYGITSSEVITGLFPFGTNGDTPMEEEDIITRIIEDGARPELPEDVCPPALAFLISKCWSVEPADRPSAAAIVRYLHDYKASLLVQAEFDYLSWPWNFNPDDSRDRNFDIEDHGYSSGDDPVLEEPVPVNPAAGAEEDKASGSPISKLLLQAKNYVSRLFQGSASSSSTGPSSAELNSKDLGITSKELETKQFPFHKIQAASNNFDVNDFKNYVGEGPFARVFRGFFTGELREAAIRQLRLEKKSDPKVFLEKVAVMASIKHPNLINMVGYCENEGEFYLVHEFINSPGTIGTVLLGFNKQGHPLREVTWNERHQIAVRVGQALAYLHEELPTPIVHGNLTTRSIMLEEPDMNPKLFDFGIQFLFPDLNLDNLNPAFSSFATELLQWTAPEHKTGTLIKKSATSDMYSFGILILVLVSGRRVIDPKYPDTTVIDSACEIYNEGEVLNFLDENLPAGSVTSEEMMLVMQVALLCLQEDPQRRPKASEAVQMFLGKVSIDPNRLMNLTANIKQSD